LGSGQDLIVVETEVQGKVFVVESRCWFELDGKVVPLELVCIDDGVESARENEAKKRDERGMRRIALVAAASVLRF
jgi:hypothetical protein